MSIDPLTATPYAGASTFLGWSGACAGSSPVCMLPMSADAKAQASFSK